VVFPVADVASSLENRPWAGEIAMVSHPYDRYTRPLRQDRRHLWGDPDAALGVVHARGRRRRWNPL